jgi:Zn-dependent protease
MNFDIMTTLKTIPAAIIGLTVHEYSHALMGYKLGDSTAKEQGRLTLNPLKHIDPLGFLLIIVAGFGWAKPVQFDPDNLKHKHRDEILIALAGPVSNLLVGILMLGIARLLYAFAYFSRTDFGLQIVNLLLLWAVINFGLFVFNLIPLPPLDGSHLYMTFLKETNPELLEKIYKYGTLALFLVIMIENRANIEILPTSSIVSFITKTCISLMGFN